MAETTETRTLNPDKARESKIGDAIFSFKELESFME